MEFKKSFQYSMLFIAMASPVVALSASHHPVKHKSKHVAKQRTVMPNSYFNGAYVGAGIGAGTFMTNTSNETIVNSEALSILDTTTTTTQGGIFTNQSSAMLYQYGVMGDLFVGYGRVLPHNIYLGALLGANFYQATDTVMHNNAHEENLSSSGYTSLDSITQKSMAAETEVTRNTAEPFFDIKLGYLARPWVLMYAKGGINYNQINVTTNASYHANGEVAANPKVQDNPACTNYSGACVKSQASSNMSYLGGASGIGYRAGIGMEVMVTQYLGVSADYVYTFYPSVSTHAVGNGSDLGLAEGAFGNASVPVYNTIPAKLAGSNKATVNDQQLLVNLIYHLS